jgi:hypothetical protein
MKIIKEKPKSLTTMDVFVTISVIVLIAIVIDQIGNEIIDTIQTIIK